MDKIEALIFDVDGVLIYSEHAKFEFLKKLYLKHELGVIPESHFNKISGRAVRFYFEETVNNKERIELLWNDFKLEYLDKIEKYLIPVLPTVNFIKHSSVPVAIASNGLKDVVNKILIHLEIRDRVKFVFTREDVTNMKPDPEIYLKCINEFSCEPNKCAIIEDSLTGIKAAIDSGAKSYLFLNGENDLKDFADLPYNGIVRTEQDLFDLV